MPSAFPRTIAGPQYDASTNPSTTICRFKRSTPGPRPSFSAAPNRGGGSMPAARAPLLPLNEDGAEHPTTGATRRPLITDAALAVPLPASGAPREEPYAQSARLPRVLVFNLGTRHEVTASVGMRHSHAALGGAVLCTTRCRQRAGGRRGGRRDRRNCRRWPRRRNGGDRRRLGRRSDRGVQPEPELRLPLPRLCRAWRLPLDTGASQPLG